MTLDALFRQQHASHAGLDLPPGRLVFDTVSTERGTILSGRIDHRVEPGRAATPGQPGAALFQLPATRTIQLYQVKLSDGTVITRSLDQLVELPAGLNVDLQEFEP